MMQVAAMMARLRSATVTAPLPRSETYPRHSARRLGRRVRSSAGGPGDLRLRRGGPTPGLLDDAPAEHDLAVVERDRLPRGGGTRRDFEPDGDPSSRRGGDDGRNIGRGVADPHRRRPRSLEPRDRDPVDLARHPLGALHRRLVPDGQGVTTAIDPRDIPGAPPAESEPPALSHGIPGEPPVLPQEAPLEIIDRSGAQPLRRKPLDDRGVIP